MTESYFDKRVKQPFWITLEGIAYSLLGASRSATSQNEGGFEKIMDLGPRVDYKSHHYGAMGRTGKLTAWYTYDANGKFLRRETLWDRAVKGSVESPKWDRDFFSG